MPADNRGQIPQTKDTLMKITSRIVALFVVSFAAASAFAADLPTTAQPAQNVGPAGHTLILVKCTNPRECSVG